MGLAILLTTGVLIGGVNGATLEREGYLNDIKVERPSYYQEHKKTKITYTNINK